MRRNLRRLAMGLPPLLWACLLSTGPAVALSRARPDAGHVEAFAQAYSVSNIASAIEDLVVGGRLHLEGVELQPGLAPVGLETERFDVFADEGRIVVHSADGQEEWAFPEHAYFRGHVIGEPASLAVLTVLEDGRVRGIIRRDDGFWELYEGSPRADGSRGLEARQVETPEGAGFKCAAVELPSPPQTALLGVDTASSWISTSMEPGSLDAGITEAASTAHTARVAIETDWELFQYFGNSTALIDYVGDLFAYASSIFDSEIATDFQVVHLSLWATAEDPYSYMSTCGLFEFGRYWNDNRSNIDRTIAHFVSGKHNTSGVAWLGVLCGGPFLYDHSGACSGLSPSYDNYGGAYGFSGGITDRFDPDNPSVVWDILAVSHEIGHNFNSPHTHCYNGLGGSASSVDECYSGEAGCYTGTVKLPGPSGAGSGTLMSYCALPPDGLSNLSLTFGTGHPYGVLPQRVPDRMRAHVELIATENPSCLERIDTGSRCESLNLWALTVSTTQLFEACGILRAGNGFSIIEPGHVTLRGTTVILESGFSVAHGATLRIETY